MMKHSRWFVFCICVFLDWNILAQDQSFLKMNKDLLQKTFINEIKNTDGSSLNDIVELYPALLHQVLDSRGLRAIHLATLEKNYSVINHLITTYRVNIDESTQFGKTALMLAVEIGDLPLIRFLVKKGANIHLRSKKFDLNLLHLASFNNNPEVVKILIQLGVDVHARAFDGSSPLHVAAQENSVEVMKILVKAGASVDYNAGDRGTPLHSAVQGKSKDALIFLLKQGANIQAKNTSQATPLLWSGFVGDIEVARILFQYGASLNDQNILGWNILHAALDRGHIEFAKEILFWKYQDTNKTGQDLTGLESNHRKATPLHFAAAIGAIDFIQAVFLKNSHPQGFDLEDENGNTPLMWAVQAKQIQTVQMFLQQGLSPDYQNKRGESPRSQSMQVGFEKIKGILEQFDSKK